MFHPWSTYREESSATSFQRERERERESQRDKNPTKTKKEKERKGGLKEQQSLAVIVGVGVVFC